MVQVVKMFLQMVGKDLQSKFVFTELHNLHFMSLVHI
jgi:hypothetical protein